MKYKISYEKTQDVEHFYDENLQDVTPKNPGYSTLLYTLF